MREHGRTQTDMDDETAKDPGLLRKSIGFGQGQQGHQGQQRQESTAYKWNPGGIVHPRLPRRSKTRSSQRPVVGGGLLSGANRPRRGSGARNEDVREAD